MYIAVLLDKKKHALLHYRGRPMSFFEMDTDIWRQISADNIGGRYYRASLIIVKFEFAYRPIFKRQISADNIVGPTYRSVFTSDFVKKTLEKRFYLTVTKVHIFGKKTITHFKALAGNRLKSNTKKFC